MEEKDEKKPKEIKRTTTIIMCIIGMIVGMFIGCGVLFLLNSNNNEKKENNEQQEENDKENDEETDKELEDEEKADEPTISSETVEKLFAKVSTDLVQEHILWEIETGKTLSVDSMTHTQLYSLLSGSKIYSEQINVCKTSYETTLKNDKIYLGDACDSHAFYKKETINEYSKIVFGKEIEKLTKKHVSENGGGYSYSEKAGIAYVYIAGEIPPSYYHLNNYYIENNQLFIGMRISYEFSDNIDYYTFIYNIDKNNYYLNSITKTN